MFSLKVNQGSGWYSWKFPSTLSDHIDSIMIIAGILYVSMSFKICRVLSPIISTFSLQFSKIKIFPHFLPWLVLLNGQSVSPGTKELHVWLLVKGTYLGFHFNLQAQSGHTWEAIHWWISLTLMLLSISLTPLSSHPYMLSKNGGRRELDLKSVTKVDTLRIKKRRAKWTQS